MWCPAQGNRKPRPGSTAAVVAGLMDSLGQQHASTQQDLLDERAKADAELKKKMADRKSKAHQLHAAASEVGFDAASLGPLFRYLDAAGTGGSTTWRHPAFCFSLYIFSFSLYILCF